MYRRLFLAVLLVGTVAFAQESQRGKDNNPVLHEVSNKVLLTGYGVKW